MRLARCRLLVMFVTGTLAIGRASAEPAAFDLAGPGLDVEVTRGAVTLPIAQVPNLAMGDRLWLKLDVPAGQTAHYLMVAAFLQGATNPPPKSWFVSCQTWVGKCSHDGMSLTVPVGAKQLLVFLAPHTGGDFKTLVNAVRGRPGAFVRTSQDLNQASLDRSRLETYLAAVRGLGDADPSRLKDAAPLLARSLAIKVDEKCLGRIAVLQAPCLTQGREALILDDGHSASIAQQLTSGPASDLAMSASNTPQLRSGYYGPFIGSMFDIARIFDSFHTAQYQYFPALTSAVGRRLALTLNAPPSFHDPKSVLVVALPAIEPPQFPPVHAASSDEALCASKDVLVLPVEGAPLVFAAEYAHDSVMHFVHRDGTSADVPVRANPARGGFVLSAAALRAVVEHDPIKATLRTRWGFQPFEGPTFRFADPNDRTWHLKAGESSDLIVGRPATLELQADSTSCLDQIMLADSDEGETRAAWKSTAPGVVTASLPLQDVKPGTLTLKISQFGGSEPQRIPLRGFSEASHLERFTVHAGDGEGVLDGNRLDEVQRLVLKSTTFLPGVLSTHDGHDQLTMQSADEGATALRPGDVKQATVTLKDLRTYAVKALIDAPRPSAALLSKSIQLPASPAAAGVRLGSSREAPAHSQLTFSIRALSPATFTHDDKLEVAMADAAASVILPVGLGGMTLQSKAVAVVTLNPVEKFGDSSFGALRFRRVVNGVAGDWQPLVTLVRVPEFAAVDCPPPVESDCSLSGTRLYLLDSVSADAQFTTPRRVPDGFTESTLMIPRPHDGKLYVRLRDDPAIVSVATVSLAEPIAPEPAAAPPDPAPAPAGVANAPQNVEAPEDGELAPKPVNAQP